MDTRRTLKTVFAQPREELVPWRQNQIQTQPTHAKNADHSSKNCTVLQDVPILTPDGNKKTLPQGLVQLGHQDATRQSFGNHLLNLETVYGSALELKLGEPLLLRRATCASGKVSKIIQDTHCSNATSLRIHSCRLTVLPVTSCDYVVTSCDYQMVEVEEAGSGSRCSSP